MVAEWSFLFFFSVDIETSEMPKECNDGGKFDIVFKTIGWR